MKRNPLPALGPLPVFIEKGAGGLLESRRVMRFKVDGARRDTGAASSMVVWATDAAEAEAIVCTQGVFVSQVSPIDEPRKLSPSAERARERRRQSNQVGIIEFLRLLTVVAFVGFVGFIAFSDFFGGPPARTYEDRPTPTFQQEQTLRADNDYRARLRSTSDDTGFSMSEFDAAVNQFRTNGVGASDEERLRLAEKAFRLSEALNHRR